MEFLLYKFYQKMISDKDEDPILRTFIYIGLNVACILFSLIVFFQSLTSFLKVKESLTDTFSNHYIISTSVFLGITVIITYLKFFYKKDMDFYKVKYENHRYNRWFSNFLLFCVPGILFFFGPIITLILFGGTSFGHEFIGILNRF